MLFCLYYFASVFFFFFFSTLSLFHSLIFVLLLHCIFILYPLFPFSPIPSPSFLFLSPITPPRSPLLSFLSPLFSYFAPICSGLVRPILLISLFFSAQFSSYRTVSCTRKIAFVIHFIYLSFVSPSFFS